MGLYLIYSCFLFTRVSADTLESPVYNSCMLTRYWSLGNPAYDRAGLKETVSQGTGQSHWRSFSLRKFPEKDRIH